MKLIAKELENSFHKELFTEIGVNVGMFFLDIDGSYYYKPNDGGGYFGAHTLRDIANLLDEINAPFDEQVKEYFKEEKRTSKIGSKVFVKNRGQIYSTYFKMFQELGFKKPDKVKELRNIYTEKEDYKDVEFTIFNIGKHKEEGIKLYAIRDEKGNEFLFNRKGLRFKR